MTTPVFKTGKKYETENRDQNFNNQRDLTICVVIKDGKSKWKNKQQNRYRETTIKE